MMEPVKKILIRLKGPIEKGEATRLCTQLLALINKDEKLVKETVSWLVSADGGPEAFHQICRQAVELDALQLIADTLSSLVTRCSMTAKYLKLILSSRIMKRLVLFLEKLPQNTPKPSSSSHSKSDPCCLITNAITSFIELQGQVTTSSLPKMDRIALLHLIIDFLKSEIVFKAGSIFQFGAYTKKTHLDSLGIKPEHASSCLSSIYSIIEADAKSDELRDLLSSPGNEVISTLIAFSKRNPSYLSSTSNIVSNILQNFEKTSHLLEMVMTFTALHINHFVVTQEEYFSSMTFYSRGFSSQKCAFHKSLETLQVIISAGTLDELQDMDNKFKTVDSLLHGLQCTDHHDLIGVIIYTFIIMIREHDLNFLTLEKLGNILPIIWGKMEKHKSMLDYFLIFMNSVILFPESHNLDVSRLEHMLVNDVIGIAICFDPPLLKVLWLMTRYPLKYKLVFNELSKMSSDKTVEYAAPGKTELAKIFKFISDIIIETLEREPPHKLNYLQNVTKCMVEIARSSSLDEEMYVLEDMVSPAMWLLKKQSNEKIVANVKEFISILH